MSGINLSAALPLLSLALGFALKGGRSPEAFAIVVAPLAFLPFSPKFREAWLPSSGGFRAVVALFAWSIAVLLSFPPLYLHLNRLCLLASYVIVAAAAATWNERERRAFMALTLVLGVVEAAAFLVQHFRVEATNGFLHGNPVYSGLAVAAGLVVLPLFIGQQRGRQLIPVAIVLTLALALIRSRSALVGFLAAVAVVAPIRRYLTGLGVLGAVILAIVASEPAVAMRYFKLDVAGPDVFGRINIWKSALRSTLEHPFAGWGMGNFEAAYMYGHAPIDAVLRYGRTTEFAHNDYFQVAVELGWIGAAIIAWILFAFARAVRRRMDDATVRGATAIVTLYAIAAVFNFTFFLPYNGFVAAAALGIGLAAQRRPAPTPRWLTARIWLSIPVLVVAFAALNGIAEHHAGQGRPLVGTRFMPIRSSLWYEAALRAFRNSDGRESADDGLAYLQKAIRWNPQDAFAWNRLGMVAAAMPKAGIDPTPAFSRALELAPHHAPFWLDAGFERLRQGDIRGAEERFLRASDLEPNAPISWLGLAAVAKAKGEKEKMTALLEKAVSVQKQYRHWASTSGYARYLFGMTEEQMRAAMK